jgi:hypothetical protein
MERISKMEYANSATSLLTPIEAASFDFTKPSIKAKG